MSEPRVLTYEEKDLRDPVAVIGFPTVGLVGSIAAGFLARGLRLPVVGGITSRDLPPYALVQNGQPFPQVRIYAGALPKTKRSKKIRNAADAPVEKKVRTKARDIIVVTSEVAPKPEDTYDLSVGIYETLKDMGASTIVCLEGVPRVNDSAKMMGVSTTKEGADLLEKDAGLVIMGEGIVRGITGIVMMLGMNDGMDVKTILCPASPQLPDPRSAAKMIEPLTTIIPRLDVDITPLLKEGDEIDSRLVAQQQASQDQGPGNIYG